ncbi:MAG TPA: class I SAM-dependent methyltransferase [Lachnoclostridium phocaeense]|uniref:Class I SAM-dependent methyltransferase n=1 Tax=Lachnoclostridium phocaeense TaxID=1871021 RepID=A0A921I1Y9_9FIRM|nr:class I SAM-dependent methyltransferase [Lachnoclostridium phocaeense]
MSPHGSAQGVRIGIFEGFFIAADRLRQLSGIPLGVSLAGIQLGISRENLERPIDVQINRIEPLAVSFDVDHRTVIVQLVQDRIEQMQLVEQAIEETTAAIREEHVVDWSRMLGLIHLTGMEKSFKNQYKSATNISARINLHSLYSRNRQGWFPWIYEKLRVESGMKILELGCGDGTLWTENKEKLPVDVSVTLSDVSEGMLRDARRAIGTEDTRFAFNSFDCHHIPYDDENFDLVIANHVLFYCQDIPAVCREVRRVLRPCGRFICSTYGHEHMKEVSQLVQEFDERIALSADKLYEKFGKENGKELLGERFSEVVWQQYEDALVVTEPEPLISYVLSCHGNQGQYIGEKYNDFRAFVKKKTTGGFRITKDAGIFICAK